MRTRTATFPTLFAGFLALSVVGCGGSDGPDTTVAALPRPTKTALDLTKIPDANGVVSTAAPTTLAPPTTLPPTTRPPTSTVLVPATVAVSLPPGVTDADRQAAEAAAIGWWEMFYDQLVALPNFDPQEILSRAAPGRPGGPAMLEQFEQFRGRGTEFKPGDFHEVLVHQIRFQSADSVIVEICSADDGKFVNAADAPDSGLGSSYLNTVLIRISNHWLVQDYGTSKPSQVGSRCVG